MLSPSHLSNITSWPSYEDIWRQAKQPDTPATAENQTTDKIKNCTQHSLSTQNLKK